MGSDFIALVILMLFVSACVYTQVRPAWQTPLGLLIIMFGWVPAGIIMLLLIKFPFVTCSVCLFFGAIAAQRRLS